MVTKESYDRPILFRCCVFCYTVYSRGWAVGFVPVRHYLYSIYMQRNIEQARERQKRAENIVFVVLFGPIEHIAS
jgi:hypothetical protein